MEDNRFPREVTLCLSGGGARGAYHLGAISVLEENNIAIKAISGTSIGALIGAALASGKTSQEIYEVFKSPAFKKIFKFTPSRTHLFTIQSEAEIINSLINKESFEELEIPLHVAVCDINSEVVEYYSSGKLFKKVVLASCSIVPLFKPVEVGDKLLIDGGVIDNFSVERLHRYPYEIIGINLYPKYLKPAHSFYSWIKKIIYVAWQADNTKKKDLCDIYLCSQALNELSAFSFKDIEKAYELGREEMKKLL